MRICELWHFCLAYFKLCNQFQMFLYKVVLLWYEIAFVQWLLLLYSYRAYCFPVTSTSDGVRSNIWCGAFVMDFLLLCCAFSAFNQHLTWLPQFCRSVISSSQQVGSLTVRLTKCSTNVEFELKMPNIVNKENVKTEELCQISWKLDL